MCELATRALRSKRIRMNIIQRTELTKRDAYYRIDCAFVDVQDAALPLVKPGLYRLGSVGAPLPLDLETMGPARSKCHQHWAHARNSAGRDDCGFWLRMVR